MTFNLDHFESELAALVSLHPEATLCGRTVLTHAEWLHHGTLLEYVAVDEKVEVGRFANFELQFRPSDWFLTVGRIVQKTGHWGRVYGLKCLPPEIALADLYGWDQTDAPKLDELCIPGEGAEKILRAFEALDVALPDDFAKEFKKNRYTTRPSVVLAENKAVVLKILAEHGMRRPYLFGSCARNDDRVGSDIDILILEDEILEVFSAAIAAETLEVVLGVPVQVVYASAMGAAARTSALSDAVPLF
jgi:predicted nucleotidyltransferase